MDVTINGVKAQESAEPGVYNAEFPTLLPTAYVLVEVSQEEWTPNQKAFSFTHASNVDVWIPAAIAIGALFFIVSLALYFILTRKSKAVIGLKRSFPIVGGILLLAASVISLYWGVVGVESTMQGFNWLLLSAGGFVSFVCGLMGSVISWRHKNQALVFFCDLFVDAC